MARYNYREEMFPLYLDDKVICICVAFWHYNNNNACREQDSCLGFDSKEGSKQEITAMLSIFVISSEHTEHTS